MTVISEDKIFEQTQTTLSRTYPVLRVSTRQHSDVEQALALCGTITTRLARVRPQEKAGFFVPKQCLSLLLFF